MREEEMVMSGYNLITWSDQRLKWNESEHPGIKFRIKIAISYNLYAFFQQKFRIFIPNTIQQVNVHPDDVWKPGVRVHYFEKEYFLSCPRSRHERLISKSWAPMGTGNQPENFFGYPCLAH